MDLSRASLDREFPSRLSTIQMNHAAISPLPARAAAALERLGIADLALRIAMEPVPQLPDGPAALDAVIAR